nr:TonB-dependent receptor [Chitinophagaceae bacterium]
MMKTLRLIAILILASNYTFGQSVAGEIYGRVTDDKKQPLEFATVQAFQGGISKGGAKTDINGNYSIKPLPPGEYELKISYVGMNTDEIKGIPLGNDSRRKVDVQLEKKMLKEVKVRGSKYVPPLVDATDPNRKGITRKQMAEAPSLSSGDFAAMAGGAYQRKAGDNGLSIGGDRSSGTVYIVDGIPIRGGRNVNFPPSGIDLLELMSNGMSAKYGNATGGVVGITTRGIQPKLSGNIQAQHSVEGYNNNLVVFDISGPLLKRVRDNKKVPLLGFGLNVSATYDKDNNPYIYKYLRVKPDKLKQLQENPLVPNPNGTGNFVDASEQITMNDLERVKAREQGDATGLNYFGKLEFQPTDNINFSLGTYFNYGNARGYSFANSLFAPEANSISKSYTARGFIRFTQRLGKSGLQEKDGAKKSPIQNAYYSIQFSYQKDYSDGANPKHKRNVFDYGYVGNFTTHRRNIYQIDTAIGGYQGIELAGEFSDSVTFYGGGINPLLENYTKAIYADDRFAVRNLTDLSSYGGLRNGDGPDAAYGLWTGPGSQISSFSYSEADQVSLNLDASVDILQGMKNVKRVNPIKHNIQFGLGYDQRTTRSYALSGSGLWSLMRLITNRHIQNLDLDNPQFIVNGTKYTLDDLNNGVVQFSPFDTINYDRLYVASEQSRFDKELRTKLNNGDPNAYFKNTDLIDIDRYDPKMFSLDMFSPDDLFNRGQDRVSYFGYDYLGKKTKSQPSFNDFWTKKDARGDNTRPIGASRPIYMFGYILDKFSYKDLNFNIGLRIDRYDANQKVLKDPYSLYGVLNNSDIKAGTYNVVTNQDGQLAPDPSTFDGDYVPYVDNNQGSIKTIVGYRKGDVWYDPFGKEIADPTVLSGLYASGLPIQPWLVNNKDSIKGANFNPNNSFDDYKPQVSLSPRIQFAFPISEEALFYGNYDVITQTPSSNNFVTPDDYYFLAERQATINNANLRMEKAINYTLGYRQKIAKNAAMTIEGYYRERKNQIQIQNFLLAYPIQYTSYGNRDFSSTKGLIVNLEYRRTGPLRMQLSYTLQFAEGTGSNTASQSSLLATGQPNLRSVFPLDFDSRHIINYTIDYRYDDRESKGPEINGKYPFKNAGINLLMRARSGEPYTRSSIATSLIGGDFQSTPIIGTINGSRLPWQFEVSTRIDKDFEITSLGRKVNKETNTVIREGRRIGINVYTYITNLLNTRNTLSVYRYTGVGNDDGYLNSPQGQQALTNIQFQQSYKDLYSYRLITPNNYNNPRRIFVGLAL